VTPTWAKLIDFETTLPSAVEELARQRDERRRGWVWLTTVPFAPRAQSGSLCGSVALRVGGVFALGQEMSRWDVENRCAASSPE
jgi:hypothetical protein